MEGETPSMNKPVNMSINPLEEMVRTLEQHPQVQELIMESSEIFREWIEKDFVSLWISKINFELMSQRRLGRFEYNTENLKFGPRRKKLCLKDLSNDELNEIINFYWAKGYTLNRTPDVIMSNPDLIVINWENPKKQTFKDKKYIWMFKISKFKKFYRYNRKTKNAVVSFGTAFIDCLDYLYCNYGYCLKATRQHKISKNKSSKEYVTKVDATVIEIKHSKDQFLVTVRFSNVTQTFNDKNLFYHSKPGYVIPVWLYQKYNHKHKLICQELRIFCM